MQIGLNKAERIKWLAVLLVTAIILFSGFCLFFSFGNRILGSE